MPFHGAWFKPRRPLLAPAAHRPRSVAYSTGSAGSYLSAGDRGRRRAPDDRAAVRVERWLISRKAGGNSRRMGNNATNEHTIVVLYVRLAPRHARDSDGDKHHMVSTRPRVNDSEMRPEVSSDLPVRLLRARAITLASRCAIIFRREEKVAASYRAIHVDWHGRADLRQLAVHTMPGTRDALGIVDRHAGSRYRFASIGYTYRWFAWFQTQNVASPCLP